MSGSQLIPPALPEVIEFEAAYRATGKRYDVGRSYVRFRKLDELPLELIGESVKLFGVNEFIERVKATRKGRKSGGV